MLDSCKTWNSFAKRLILNLKGGLIFASNSQTESVPRLKWLPESNLSGQMLFVVHFV
jgi:hypothetical protein